MLTWFAVCVCVWDSTCWSLHDTKERIQVYKNRWSRIICKEYCIFRNVAKWDPFSSFSGHSGIYSDILSVFFLAYVSSISADILSGILPAISSEILCGWGLAGNTITLWSGACGWGRRETLWSGACGGGPARNTLIRSTRWGPAGNTLTGACGGDPAGTLWSGACGGGPAANTAIQSF